MVNLSISFSVSLSRSLHLSVSLSICLSFSLFLSLDLSLSICLSGLFGRRQTYPCLSCLSQSLSLTAQHVAPQRDEGQGPPPPLPDSRPFLGASSKSSALDNLREHEGLVTVAVFPPKCLPQIMVFGMSINRLDYTKWPF